MNIHKITYMFKDNSKVMIEYDELGISVKTHVDPLDSEVQAWILSGNTITEYPFGDYSEKGDPNPNPNNASQLNPIAE